MSIGVDGVQGHIDPVSGTIRVTANQILPDGSVQPMAAQSVPAANARFLEGAIARYVRADLLSSQPPLTPAQLASWINTQLQTNLALTLGDVFDYAVSTSPLGPGPADVASLVAFVYSALSLQLPAETPAPTVVQGNPFILPS